MQTYFQYFSSPINEIELPKNFTFPFYYEPHLLSQLAAKELQDYLKTQTDFDHNFGLDASKKGEIIGKMFGVLVVQNQENEIGYIAAVSGKLADKNDHIKFVPPVYDMLTEASYYLKEKEALLDLDAAIKAVENSDEYEAKLAHFKAENKKAAIDIREKKDELNAARSERKARRSKAKIELSPEDYAELEETLKKESLASKYFFNDVTRYYQHTLQPLKDEIAAFEDKIAALKVEQKAKSIALQQYISDQYHFLNIKKEVKNLSELFEDTALQHIPAGSGECAAPKLLQYAFLNDLKPISMAEFWWGQSPNKEIRKHGQFYPACQGKCKPILGHMLKGIEMDENPLLENPAIGKELEIVYEDDEFLVINKPADFLSVPGIHIQDSVYTRMKQQIKDISGPIVVHRLDMATSGLLVIAKNKKSHQFIQRQFIERTVSKRYTALLDGNIEENKGTVDLPIRVDLDDRPRQLVCYDHGRPSVTNWEVVERKNGQTKVHFYPITGRSHQLRVHSSHAAGLHIPIVGDDLYGTKADRLYLHADTLTFTHPTTRQQMTFYREAEF